MRLIDADALPRHKQLEAMGNGQYEDVEIVYGNDIDNASTIEAEPVRHGWWNVVDFEEPRRWGCSECYVLSWDTSRYCPNCGAKMDGGTDEK